MPNYVCRNCSRTFTGFHLACPECGAWSALRPEADRVGLGDARPVPLSGLGSVVIPRIRTKIEKVDEVLGEGFVPGSSVLLIGEPGAGKSTLVLQLLVGMNIPSLYITGEESLQQLKLRANRLKIDSPDIFLLFETNVNRIAAHVRERKPGVVVIDSIQTMYTEASDALAGSPTQIRKCAYMLRRLALRYDIVLMIVGQVTKNKTAAGPKLLEHAVDVVLSLEVHELNRSRRILTAWKNRFGSTTPRCTLRMEGAGLVVSGKQGGQE